MASSVGERTGLERSSTADVAGVVVLGCCAAWALASAAGRDARPEGVLLALLAVAAGYATGRIGAALLPVGASVAAAAGGLFLLIAAPPGVPHAVLAQSPGPGGATAALPALVSAAACCAAAAARSTAARWALWLLAASVAGVSLGRGSTPGCVAALAVLLAAGVLTRTRHRLPALAALTLAVCAVVGGCWVVAEGGLPRTVAGAVDGQRTLERASLWGDAADVAREHPVLGSGPDSFGGLRPAAREDLGADGKPHSAALQMAAEQGVPGALLLGASFGWILYGLWRSQRPTPVVLAAGAGLTVVAALAATTNALSFVQVTAGVGVLAGLAMARPLGEEREPGGAEG